MSVRNAVAITSVTSAACRYLNNAPPPYLCPLSGCSFIGALWFPCCLPSSTEDSGVPVPLERCDHPGSPLGVLSSRGSVGRDPFGARLYSRRQRGAPGARKRSPPIRVTILSQDEPSPLNRDRLSGEACPRRAQPRAHPVSRCLWNRFVPTQALMSLRRNQIARPQRSGGLPGVKMICSSLRICVISCGRISGRRDN